MNQDNRWSICSGPAPDRHVDCRHDSARLAGPSLGGAGRYIGGAQILATSVRVMHKVWSELSAGQRHLQRVSGQLGAQMGGERPADHAPTECIRDDRQVQPALPGAYICDIGDLQPIGRARVEVASGTGQPVQRFASAAPLASCLRGCRSHAAQREFSAPRTCSDYSYEHYGCARSAWRRGVIAGWAGVAPRRRARSSRPRARCTAGRPST